MKDAVGNELHVGDLVMLQLERPVVFGRIIDASDGGGLVVGGGEGNLSLRPGRILIMSQHPIDFDPKTADPSGGGAAR